MSDFITSGEGNFFVQLSRDERFDWLTCAGINDVDIPRGDSTVVMTCDPLRSGQFKIDGFIKGTPGAGTYTIVKPLSLVYNFLVEQNCPFVGRINWVCRGTRQEPTNYEVAALLFDSDPDRSRIRNPVASSQDDDGRVNTEMDVSFTDLAMLYQISLLRVAVSNTNDANAVVFLPELCESRCGPARDLCAYGIIGCDSETPYVYDPEVKITKNGLVLVEETVTDPFVFGGIIWTVEIADTLGNPRLFVFRGAPVYYFPAEMAYSDDHGATWTNVNVGTTVLQYILGSAWNGANLFCTCDDGYIYMSTDMGATWTAVELGVASGGEPLHDIIFADENYGYAVGGDTVNIQLITTDGGLTWGALANALGTGHSNLSVACNDLGHVFVGNNTGEIFVSRDQGVTWTLTVNHAEGRIEWIEFDPDHFYVGAYIWNDAATDGLLYRSEDGGASWPLVPGMPANDGINSGHICDPNNIVVVGNVATTTFIAKTVT